MAIVEVSDIETLEGASFDDDEWTQVDALIGYVQGELEAYLDRKIEVGTYTETVTVNMTEGSVRLRHTPVLSIDSVQVGGGLVDPALFSVRSWGIDLAGSNGSGLLDPVVWSGAPFQYGGLHNVDVRFLAEGGYPVATWTVTYTAGYDGANDPALKSVLIRAVRRARAEVAEGLASTYTRMSVEDYSWQKNERLMMQMVGPFTAGDLKMLQRYRRKVIAA